MNMNTSYLQYLCLTPTTELMSHLEKRYRREGAVAEKGYVYVPRGRTNVLAVAHCDTVADSDIPRYAWREIKTPDGNGNWKITWEQGERIPGEKVEYKEYVSQKGRIVNTIALDDRLGVWVLTQVLPSMGIYPDLLFTTGEEQGASTAAEFVPPEGKNYNWIFEFDRRDDQPVLYEFDDQTMRDRLKAVNVIPTFGSFSDICYMEHLGIKAINWNVCYTNEHTSQCWVNLSDLRKSIRKFKAFWKMFQSTLMPHTRRTKTAAITRWNGSYGLAGQWGGWTDEEDDEFIHRWDTARVMGRDDHTLRIEANMRAWYNTLEAMQDTTTHIELVETRGGNGQVNNYKCKMCGCGLYASELFKGLCCFCDPSGKSHGVNCPVCEQRLYGVEITRGICQDCAHDCGDTILESIMETQDELEEEYLRSKTGLHSKTNERRIVPYTGAHAECALCGNHIKSVSVFNAEYGTICLRCNGILMSGGSVLVDEDDDPNLDGDEKQDDPECRVCHVKLSGEAETLRGTCTACELFLSVGGQQLEGGG